MLTIQWMDEALCVEIGTEPFFPERDIDIPQAVNICQRCPVQPDCLSYAMKLEVNGIWGGTTERDRRRMKRVA